MTTRPKRQPGSRDGIARMSVTHNRVEFLVWSKRNAYEYTEYKTFERDVAAHVIGMLREAGCKDRLGFRLQAETCADGVLCTRITVENAPDYGHRVVAPGVAEASTPTRTLSTRTRKRLP